MILSFLMIGRPGPQDNLNHYDIWVVNLTEVEIDCLTGESKVKKRLIRMMMMMSRQRVNIERC